MTPTPPSNPAALPGLLLHSRWRTADIELLHGFDNTTKEWTDEDLVLGLANPNMVTAPIEVFLRSSAALSGSPEIPSTWIPMPGLAVGSLSPDGQIGPMDVAHMYLRLSVGLVPDAIYS